MTSDISFTCEKLRIDRIDRCRRQQSSITRCFDTSCFLHDFRFVLLRTAFYSLREGERREEQEGGREEEGEGWRARKDGGCGRGSDEQGWGV